LETPGLKQWPGGVVVIEKPPHCRTIIHGDMRHLFHISVPYTIFIVWYRRTPFVRWPYYFHALHVGWRHQPLDEGENKLSTPEGIRGHEPGHSGGRGRGPVAQTRHGLKWLLP
jgi:hypothetical protein